MGCACSGSVSGASLAASLEAIQTRLTLIAGSRDDLQGKAYESLAPSALPLRPLESRRLDEPGSDDNPTQRLNRLMDALRDAGIEGVYVFDLATLDVGFHVVRVLADDVLSPARPPAYVYSGEKAKRMMRGWMA